MTTPEKKQEAVLDEFDHRVCEGLSMGKPAREAVAEAYAAAEKKAKRLGVENPISLDDLESMALLFELQAIEDYEP